MAQGFYRQAWVKVLKKASIVYSHAVKGTDRDIFDIPPKHRRDNVDPRCFFVPSWQEKTSSRWPIFLLEESVRNQTADTMHGQETYTPTGNPGSKQVGTPSVLNSEPCRTDVEAFSNWERKLQGRLDVKYLKSWIPRVGLMYDLFLFVLQDLLSVAGPIEGKWLSVA